MVWNEAGTGGDGATHHRLVVESKGGTIESFIVQSTNNICMVMHCEPNLCAHVFIGSIVQNTQNIIKFEYSVS